MTCRMARPLYILIGVFFVALGFVGIFLPVLPTTPFLLIAVWAFSRGSPRLERWLLQHPKLGPAVLEWRAHRIIPLKAKLLASAMMTASFLYLLLGSGVALRFVMMAGATMGVGAGYIWSKPHRAPDDGARPCDDDADECVQMAPHPPQEQVPPVE